MDWDMFSPEDHEFLRFLETNVLPVRYEALLPKAVPPKAPKPPKVQWRVYGDKTNHKTGVHRRYYKCMCCLKGRRVVISKDGYLVENKTYQRHTSSCPLRRKKGG